VGDRVLLPFPIFCGSCFYCQRGMTSSCERTNPGTDAACGVYGYGHLTGGYEGGQAEYVRAPFIAVDAERIPDDLDDLSALPLTDAMATGYYAAEMCDLGGGETVVVYGAGPVGLFAMRSAWLMGAGRVIAVDRVAYRLEFARRWAGVETVNFEDVDIVTTIKGMTDDRGADASIDAVGCEAAGSAAHRALGVYGKLEAGSPVAFNWCVHGTRKGGTLSVVGVYGPPYAAFDFGTAMNKQQTIRTGQCPVKRYLPRLVEHVRAGRIDPKPVFTHRLPLEDAPGAYHTFAQKKDGCIKVALFPGGTTVH
jgi:threonine dehydrogenase-like Zn-dependent dehydrogenase